MSGIGSESLTGSLPLMPFTSTCIRTLGEPVLVNPRVPEFHEEPEVTLLAEETVPLDDDSGAAEREGVGRRVGADIG